VCVIAALQDVVDVPGCGTMWVMSDQLWSLPWPDDRIWVRLKPGWTSDPNIRWRIEGNAHTHRGHFHVSARNGSLSRTVNAADVVDASPEARLWLDGFLRGQEATLLEFMGSSEDLLARVDDDDLARWQTWNARFRANGSAPGLNHLPPRVQALGRIADPVPWCHVAGRYWIWQEDAWVVASPQPDATQAVAGWAWQDSICAARAHHSLSDDDYGPVVVCEDCHEVTAIVVEPDTAST
jgi:hypothetical protein